MLAAHTRPLRVLFFPRASELQSVCKNSNHSGGLGFGHGKRILYSEMESANCGISLFLSSWVFPNYLAAPLPLTVPTIVLDRAQVT